MCASTDMVNKVNVCDCTSEYCIDYGNYRSFLDIQLT